MFKELKNKVRQLAKEGLFHIFGSGVLAKLGGIISSVVVVRNLPKTDYGSYVDAENLYAYLVIFIGLGVTTAMLQYCSERITEDRKNALYRYSLRTGMLGNFLLLPVAWGLAALKYHSGETVAAGYLMMLSFLPFFTYTDQYFQIVLRVKLKNTDFSHTNMIYTVIHVGGNILFTLLWGVPGLIASQYVAHLVAAAHSIWVLKKEHFFSGLTLSKEPLDRSFKKEYMTYALLCAITNFASTALVLLDVTCLGLVLQDAEVLADYKVAATIPSAMAFVPKTLMTFFYPKLVQSFSDSKKKGFHQVFQISKVYLLVNGVIGLGLLIGAPLIVWILYGDKYMNVVPIFQILSLNYMVYCARNITGNAIVILKKAKINLLFATISGVLNVALNLALIPWLGSIGAAVATLIVTCCITCLNIFYLWRYYKKD